ncbi:MAG: DUF2007 domain-containing protein [Phycisphaerales bacterium]|nr:DUF2007 domain-containing protein [Phycisphaerales bacterium]
MNQDLPDDLVVLLQTPSAFQANALVALLEDSEINALAMEETLMGALNPSTAKTVVLVREADLTKAQFTIDHARRTARDINWEEVDVGDEVAIKGRHRRTENQKSSGSLPPVIFLLAILGILLVVVGILAGVISLFLPVPDPQANLGSTFMVAFSHAVIL